MANVKRILIAGASGLIGTRLTELLLERGHQVSHLSRERKNSSIKSYTWNVKEQTIDTQALQSADVIINLAGAGIADKRWTKNRKQEILESRTQSTLLLFNELKKNKTPVKSFVSASAIGYYGIEDNEKVFIETDKPGHDFLAYVTTQWEQEADKVSTLGIRVVKLRTGIVLSEKGGALKELAKPITWLIGSPLGSGKQNLSWIHIDDLCAMYIKAVEDESMRGAYNATGPYPVTNRKRTKAIARTLHKPILLPPVPGFVLRIILGEMASLVLKGSKVSSEKIQKSGFVYKFDTLEESLANLLL